jgi:hypothetical protein
MDLQTRVTNILTKPKQEWTIIAGESTNVETLYKEYIALLAAVPAVCNFIGMTLVGIPVPYYARVRVGLDTGLASLVVGYILSLAAIYVAAIIVQKLAPTFESAGGTVQALKLVAYASTPIWVAGVFQLFPPLAPLGLVAGLYAIYLFYLGVAPLMRTPADKVIPYMAVSALVLLLIYVIVGAITGAVTGTMYRP